MTGVQEDFEGDWTIVKRKKTNKKKDVFTKVAPVFEATSRLLKDSCVSQAPQGTKVSLFQVPSSSNVDICAAAELVRRSAGNSRSSRRDAVEDAGGDSHAPSAEVARTDCKTAAGGHKSVNGSLVFDASESSLSYSHTSSMGVACVTAASPAVAVVAPACSSPCPLVAGAARVVHARCTVTPMHAVCSGTRSSRSPRGRMRGQRWGFQTVRR